MSNVRQHCSHTLQLLLDRGACIERPHALTCSCSTCKRQMKEDSLRHSLLRIHCYRALASPAWMSLTSADPVLTAFKMSRELKILAMQVSGGVDSHCVVNVVRPHIWLKIVWPYVEDITMPSVHTHIRSQLHARKCTFTRANPVNKSAYANQRAPFSVVRQAVTYVTSPQSLSNFTCTGTRPPPHTHKLHTHERTRACVVQCQLLLCTRHMCQNTLIILSKTFIHIPCIIYSLHFLCRYWWISLLPRQISSLRDRDAAEKN